LGELRHSSTHSQPRH